MGISRVTEDMDRNPTECKFSFYLHKTSSVWKVLWSTGLNRIGEAGKKRGKKTISVGCVVWGKGWIWVQHTWIWIMVPELCVTLRGFFLTFLFFFERFLNWSSLPCKIKIIKPHRDMMRDKGNNEYSMVKCGIHSGHSVNERY